MRAMLEPDVNAFAERVLPWLSREPVLHSVICTVVESVVTDPARYDSKMLVSVVDGGGEPVGVAIRTAPWPLALTAMPDAALEALVGCVEAELPDLPEASGPTPVIDRFARLWTARTGTVARVGMAQRMYRLDAVTAPAGVSGSLRRGDSLGEYRELFVEWARAFVREIEGEEARGPEAVIDRLLARDGLWVWCDDGEPVGFASATAPAFGVVRVGLVYTPPALRGRGYASALVAGVSERVLRAGNTPMLYTDLANPTSNAIYQRVGYRPVADAAQYTFRPGSD